MISTPPVCDHLALYCYATQVRNTTALQAVVPCGSHRAREREVLLL